MRLTRRTCALFLAAALAGQVAVAPADAAGPAASGSLTADFTRAAAEFDVPRDLLVAVAYGETRLDGHGGLPSQANGYGVMHLVSNPTQHSLERAATLTGEPVDRLRSVTSANIRGGAAVLRDLADDEGLTGGARDRLSAWYPVVARYSAAVDASTARLYADHVYDLLRTGIAAGAVRVAPRPLRPELGRYAGVAPAGAAGANVAAAVPEYAPARWVVRLRRQLPGRPVGADNHSGGARDPGVVRRHGELVPEPVGGGERALRGEIEQRRDHPDGARGRHGLPRTLGQSVRGGHRARGLRGQPCLVHRRHVPVVRRADPLPL